MLLVSPVQLEGLPGVNPLPPAGTASVEINLELGIVDLKSPQSLICVQQRQRAVGTNGHIWQPRGAVTAHTVATEAMDAHFEMLVIEQPTGICADATANLAVVECTGRRSSSGRGRNIRINTVAERADQAEDLVVSELRLKGHFHHVIGRHIEGVIGSGIEESASCTGVANDEVA